MSHNSLETAPSFVAPRLKISNAWWLFAAMLLLPLLLNGGSLWIDEAQTANYAKLPSIELFGLKIAEDNRTGGLSEGLMPLSMFLAWASARLFGISEIGLRIPNLVYLAIGFVCVWKVGVRLKLHALVLIFALHPFVWYYAGEVRPYALQLALGCGLLWSMMAIFENPKSRLPWVAYCATCFLLFASSLLCCIPVAASGVVLLGGLLSSRWKPSGFVAGCIVASSIPFLLLATFYVKALQAMPSIPQLRQFGPSNLAYTLYELLGFQGLGPARTELRQAASTNTSLWDVLAPHAIPLGALFLVISVITIHGIAKWNRQTKNPQWIIPFFVVLLTICAFSGIGLIKGLPFWGRHLSPILPFFVLALALLCRLFTARFQHNIAIFSICALWLLSSALFRFSPRFANDDYRGAAAFVTKALTTKGTVWWAADRSAGSYYGLRPTNPNDEGGVHFIRNVVPTELSDLPSPAYIVISKPDIYDNSKTICNFVANNRYELVKKLVSFEIWKNPNTPYQ